MSNALRIRTSGRYRPRVRDLQERLAEAEADPGKVLAGCEGKQAFETKPEADQALKRLARSSRGRRRNVYRCPLCKRWHMGSSMP